MKRCSSCHRHKEDVEFSRNRSRKDGLGNCCKPCQKKYYALWRKKVNS